MKSLFIYLISISAAAFALTACGPMAANTNTVRNVNVTVPAANSTNTPAVLGNSEAIASAKTDDSSKEGRDSEREVPDMHNAENSLDWHGTYTGTLPCADCEGIKTTIELKGDKTFTRKDEYLGRKAQTFNESGTFIFDDDGTTIIMTAKDETTTAKVTEGALVLLDSENKETKGPMGAMYVLKKK